MELEFSIYDKMLIAIAACIITINVYVTSLFVRKPQLRKNSSVLLFSLTMADLFTGFVTVPLIIAAKPVMVNNIENAKFLFIFGDIATVMSASLTISSLCAVTADRYARLCYPMKHMMFARRKRVVALFCFIWIAAFSAALIPLAWLHKVLRPNPSKETYKTVHRMDTEYSIVGAALFAIPVIGLTIAFVRMFYAIRKLGQDERRLSIDAGQEERRRKRERKAIVLFGSMFILFMICWVPWITLRPFVSTQVFDEIPKSLLNVLVFVRFLTSIFNPVLYTLHEQNYYRALIADKDKIVMCIQGGWNRQRSTSGDSAYNLALYRSHRKGTLLSTLKSQDDVDNTTSFTPSPIVVRNGHLHSGHIHAKSVPNAGKVNHKQDGPTSLPLWVPPKSSLNSKKADSIVWNIPCTEHNEAGERKMEFSERCKNVEDINGNGDGNEGSQRHEEAAIEQQRSSDCLKNPAGWESIKPYSENVKSTNSTDMKEPLLRQQQEEAFETMLRKANNGHFDESDGSPGRAERKLDRMQHTRSLLKTSFIGKLFNADELDAR